MDIDQALNTVVEKAERITPFRGVVSVACLADKTIKIVCTPINLNHGFWNEENIRKNQPGFNPDSLEAEFFQLAVGDVMDCLGQMFKDADSQVLEDTGDGDLSLGGLTSGAYALDSEFAVSVMINPYSQEMQTNTVRKMRS